MLNINSLYFCYVMFHSFVHKFDENFLVDSDGSVGEHDRFTETFNPENTKTLVILSQFVTSKSQGEERDEG